MGKKIIVITGSPRIKGNSNAMTEAFIKAAERKGHKVTRYDAANMTLGGCHACKRCYTTGKACIHDDDFNILAPCIEAADAVVFSMPVYWYSIPAQIKCVIDKFYAFMVAGRNVAGKQCALLGCCAEENESALQGVRRPVEMMVDFLGWQLIGEVLVPGVEAVGDIRKTDALSRAEALADLF